MNAPYINQRLFNLNQIVKPVAYCGYHFCLGFILTGFLALVTSNTRAQAISEADSIKLANALHEVSTQINDPITKQEFETLWNVQGLTLTQKLDLADLIKKLSNHHRQQNDLATIVVYAQKNGNIDSEKLTTLLEVCQKLVRHYSPQSTATALTSLTNFFLHNALYYSNFNQLIFIAGSYDFEFIEPEEGEPVVAAPYIEASEDLEDMEMDEESESESWVVDEDGFEISSTDFEEEIFEEDIFEESVPSVVLAGPMIKFENTNLIIRTPFDSVAIKGTSGNFVLVEEVFDGQGGKMDWATVGFSPDSVYCLFNKYQFPVSRPQITVDGADLFYLGILDSLVKGSFRFTSTNSINPDYPQFISNEGNHLLRNLESERISLIGGISLEGNRVSTESKSGAYSMLKGTGNQGTSFEASAQNFFIEDSIIYTSGPASIVLRQGFDSIYHPGMKLSFYANSTRLRLIEDQSQFRHTPLTSSRFHMDMYSSLIDWDLNSDSINISILNAKNVLPVTFESHDYFNEARFNSLSGLNDFNPLVSAMGYSRKVNSLEFTSHDLALSINRDPDIIRSAIIALSYDGYVEFDPETDVLHITRKGVHNYLSQRRRRDYDFLSIASVIAEQPNATLDLKTNEMKIRGVDKIYVSRKQDVFIEPDSSEITLMANRNFYFHGSVTAGNFQYVGKDFLFDYDSFLVHLPKVESIKLQEKSTSDGSQEKQGLNNQIIESGGVLYINKPNNKSALKDFPEYPIYTASSGAVFYFNNPEILDGAYDRTVYFTVPPFTLDSVSNSDAATVSFNGTFHSGGLFPDFEEKVSVMPDNSLGFVHNIPEEGYQLYGDRGTLYNMITMDNRGLRSAGTITFNTTTLESNDFTFYQDSVTTTGTEARIEESSDENYVFPEVAVTDYRMTWLPDKDKMFLSNVEDPFVLFHETAWLDGSITVSSQDAGGSGTLITRGSKTVSNQMTLKSDEVLANGARFEIESSDSDKPHLVGDGVSLDFQLSTEIATLKLEKEGMASIELPHTQIRTSIPKVEWNIAEGKVYLDNLNELDPNRSFILTTRPSLDSLKFQATSAVYDLQDHSLDISGIPYINVADAQISPMGQRLKIFEGATLPRLVEAELIIDTLNRFHRLYDGDIAIISRKAFQGSATYSYTNTQDETFGIRMTDFDLRSTLR